MSSPGYREGPLVIPLTVQMRLIWALPNLRYATNVLHAIVSTEFAPSEAIANAVFDEIAVASATTDYLAFLASGTALSAIDLRDVREKNKPAIPSNHDGLPGTGVGNALPEGVALVATLSTEFAGRAHRGRTYLCGFDDSVLDAAGHATDDLVAAAQAFMYTVKNAMLTQGLTLGVGHRGHDSYTNHLGKTVEAEEPGTDRVITVKVRDNIFDSQRRRK